jgi:hypothetical protein
MDKQDGQDNPRPRAAGPPTSAGLILTILFIHAKNLRAIGDRKRREEPCFSALPVWLLALCPHDTTTCHDDTAPALEPNRLPRKCLNSRQPRQWQFGMESA